MTQKLIKECEACFTILKVETSVKVESVELICNGCGQVNVLK